MERSWIAVISLLLVLGSCSTKGSKRSVVELKDQNVRMELPEGWSFDGDELVNENGEKKGEWTLGVVTPEPYISCEEYANRFINQGEEMNTNRGSYGFMRGEGGDVFIENDELQIARINDRSVYRIKSDITSYWEDDETGEAKMHKGIRCGYCVELDNNKIGLFTFYPESENEIGLADTLISSMALIR